MIRRPPRSTQGVSSAASDVYKRQLGEFLGNPKVLYVYEVKEYDVEQSNNDYSNPVDAVWEVGGTGHLGCVQNGAPVRTFDPVLSRHDVAQAYARLTESNSRYGTCSLSPELVERQSGGDEVAALLTDAPSPS